MTRLPFLPRKAIVTSLIVLVFVLLAVSMGYALDSSTPLISDLTPADGATLISPNTTISGSVYDPDGIASGSLKLNGLVISSTLQYSGHWEDDPDNWTSVWV
ncbi:MAG TPA: hypothetical protein VHS59_12005, partial [Bacillota bacterium]|nr:hypothetical protein [Bacillota bacterium]